jgi:hypothetical protein
VVEVTGISLEEIRSKVTVDFSHWEPVSELLQESKSLL